MVKSLASWLQILSLILLFSMQGKANTCAGVLVNKTIEWPAIASLVEVRSKGWTPLYGGVFRRIHSDGTRAEVGPFSYNISNIKDIRVVRENDLVEIESFDVNDNTIKTRGGVYLGQQHDGERTLIGTISTYTQNISRVRIAKPGDLVEVSGPDPNSPEGFKETGILIKQYNNGSHTQIGNSHFYTPYIFDLRILRSADTQN
jgi:hypothetical protein